MRQPAVRRNLDPRPGTSVSTLAYDYSAGSFISEHAHGSDQLIFASRGVMEIHSSQSVWLIPPSFAIWVPALLRHRIRIVAAASMRTLYVRPGLVQRSNPGCEVLSVSPLLRELILEAVQVGRLRLRNAEHCALRDLLVVHVARATPVPVQIRMPKEPRALQAASIICEEMADAPSLHSVCRASGISPRTLQRLFRMELGSDVQAWRHQVRLTKAVEQLLAGSSVKQAAFAVGYKQSSAFVAAFRRTFGSTPSQWAASVSGSKS